MSGVGLTNAFAGVSNTVIVQAKDSSGNAQTRGGDTFYLDVDYIGSMTGLPIRKKMTDKGDGTYTVDYTVPSSGSFIVRVDLVKPGGLMGEYFNNMNWSGTPAVTKIDPTINFSNGLSTPTQTDYISFRWSGILIAPYSEVYTFHMFGDDVMSVYFDGVLFAECDHKWTIKTKVLTAQTPYKILVQHHDTWGSQARILWSSESISEQAISSNYFQHSEKVGVQNVMVQDTIVPTKCTFTATPPVTHIAGHLYTMTMQSRDFNGNTIDSPSDDYVAKLTRSDGKGFEQLTTTAVYQPGGLYKAYITPTIAGKYYMTVHMTNSYTVLYPPISTEIIGSSYTLTVNPGLVDPTLCYSDIPLIDIPKQTANVAFNYKINFVDLYGNLHFQTMLDDNLSVVINAVYKDHDDWLSPIGVADFTDWQTIYGTSILGTASDNNDGTMTGSVTIKRAGSYALSIKVNGIDIIGSPHLSIKVQPANLFAPSCVPVKIPLTMYAGYQYSFLIQGRDMFHNNIADLLTNAVGAEQSIIYSLISDRKVTVNAQILDDIAAGVYLVKVTLPKTLKTGDYDLEILLRGLKVPSPVTLVKPCTNSIAFDLGILSGAGETVQLKTLDYTLGFASESIQLPIIPFYCEQEHARILMSASAIFPDDSWQELNEALLNSYGITVIPMGKNPFLKVFSADKRLGGVTFQLEIIVTVIGDTSFDNTALVTISYQKYQIIHTFQQLGVDKPPRFDSKSSSKKSLSIVNDETGAQIFTPIVMFCNLEWASALPAIHGEEKGEKFILDVSLGSASQFLSFQRMQRTFEQVPWLNKLEREVFTVKIHIVNQKGLSSLYDLKVNYLCPQQEKDPQARPLNSYQYRFDENPPKPYIHSISPQGEVKIRFNSRMEPNASLNATEIYSSKRKLRMSKNGQVLGEPTKSFKNFTSIHNSSVRINGTDYPSLSVAIQPIDPEDACASQLDFIWTCVDFTPDELTLQLDFSTPECVSGSTNEGDELVVTFYDQRIFSDSFKKLILPEIVIKAKIRRQISSKGKTQAALEALASSASTAIVSTSVFSVILNFFLQAGLNKLISMLKNLQIIIHIMLIQVYLVPHAEIFLEQLAKILAFQVYNLSDIFKQIFDVEQSRPIDIRFESLGYETSDTILNLGPIFAAIILVPFLVILAFIFSRFCCCVRVKNFFKKQYEGIFFNGIIQFIEGTSLMIVVCCTINIYQADRGVASKNSSYYFAICAISTAFIYIFILIWQLHLKFSQLGSEPVKKCVGAAYTHLAVSEDKAGRSVLVFLLLQFKRRIALAFAITYAQSVIMAQLLFMNFGSILLLIFVGRYRPLTSNWDNILEMLNEYTILVLYCIAITQTDFVTEIYGRNAMGWVVIVIICFNILLNFGNILVQDLCTLWRKIKFWYLKRVFLKKQQLWRERKMRIDIYKMEQIAKYWKDLAQESKRQGANLKNASSLGGEQDLQSKSSYERQSLQSDSMSQTIKNEQNIPLKVQNSSSSSKNLEFSETCLLVDSKLKLATDRANHFGMVAPISQPILHRLNEASHETKVEDFEEEKQLIVTPEMLLTLYDEELVKLQDPNYPGGGLYPPYGPRITFTEQIRDRYLPFTTQRMRYCSLLMKQYYKKLEDQVLNRVEAQSKQDL